MADKIIGIIAAIPKEISSLVRRFDSTHCGVLAGCQLHRFESHGKQVFLMASGMGIDRAARATAALIEAASPDLIINIGFGGMALPGPAVGDIVIATELLLLENGLCSHTLALDQDYAEKLHLMLREPHSHSFRVHRGTFVTVREITPKTNIVSFLPPDTSNPLLEMESAAVAQVAKRKGVPVLAIRAISDAADEELKFSIHDFVDDLMQIRHRRVLLTVARKPWVIPQLIRLARNSSMAADNLAAAVLTLLRQA